MKILVTGGAGFIGSHIVDAYIEAGHQVSIIDNFATGRRENVNSQATLYEMNIKDPKVKTVFADEQFDIVNMQAAQMDVRLSVRDPLFDAENNILGMINLLQNCVENNVKKVIFASSGGAIYGEQEQYPAPETHPLQPYSPYGITKLTGEKYLFFYKLSYGLDYVAFRYANVYGPRQNPHGEAGVVAIFAQAMLNDQEVYINGDGLQTRDFVYVDDVVNANLLALESQHTDIYNVGTGKETTILTIYEILNELTGYGKSAKHRSPQSGEQRRSVIAYDKIAQQMDWAPHTELKTGLAETLKTMK
ncbi:NAD-dependent epimerase/dehydratase family protein [candidate division KSB1 bacterium]|nr:NAD-dependent epimerase/dehydratase family protein [candidate division KSB1 bacterium]